ncbi:uncharacterized protein K460DRAFT_400184 [Cucurbitaria berberidis CBS 394.84]|uniref:Uncharacterized protein n=1 Tax=Cucurbitaria berberidis CBS 394.84 TaxID=1168544 RepID=A0A9P4GP67_9PLEO|nr:uncharacterized protein K460DRAFT_400184 [Cucurbitaria berberidis CBS 394.84]KAF1850098.1 hypothetical protein K460DRAFT_400184 [Cucurbitaria berberidis CBS 394.84]
MAQLQFPHFRTWLKGSTTLVREMHPPNELGDGPRTPCEFMPQSTPPVMILSSTSRRTHRSVDERAVRLLSSVANSFRDDDEDYDDIREAEHNDCSYLDINQTPMTPPMTPVTPTTDTSLSSISSMFSVDCFKSIRLYSHFSSQAFYTLLAFVLSLLTCFLVVALFGVEGMKIILGGMVWKSWGILAALSDVLEIGIEGAGFICGRVVGRFGRGFERGYSI